MNMVWPLYEVVGVTLAICFGIVVLVNLSGYQRHRLFQQGGIDLVDTMAPPQFAELVRQYLQQTGLNPTLPEEIAGNAFLITTSSADQLKAYLIIRSEAAIQLTALQNHLQTIQSHTDAVSLITNCTLYPDAQALAKKQKVAVIDREQLIRMFGKAKFRKRAEAVLP